jgi:DNA-binding NarL/FixJ family response regulator
LKIAIIDDHPFIRDLLAACCSESGEEVVGEAGTGSEAVTLILKTKPDLALLDIQLPILDGFQVVELARQGGAKCGVLMISGYCDDRTVYRVEKAKVQGFMDKPASCSRSLRLALAAVSKGGTYFSCCDD